jgi:Arc/MetJ family transcription regulator
MATRTTTLEIDEAKFGQVKRVLGTTTLRETVDRSFDEVLARAARQKSIARLQKMDGLDLHKRRVMERAWR